MFDLASEHAGFVIASYGLSFTVLAALVAVTLLRAGRHRSGADGE